MANAEKLEDAKMGRTALRAALVAAVEDIVGSGVHVEAFNGDPRVIDRSGIYVKYLEGNFSEPKTLSGKHIPAAISVRDFRYHGIRWDHTERRPGARFAGSTGKPLRKAAHTGSGHAASGQSSGLRSPRNHRLNATRKVGIRAVLGDPRCNNQYLKRRQPCHMQAAQTLN